MNPCYLNTYNYSTDICSKLQNNKTMTTKINIFKKTAILISLSLILLGGYSCKETQTSNENESTSQKVEKPNMDIYAAVFMSNNKAIEQHIKIGSELNGRDAYGSTPLNIAITFGKNDIAILLMDAQANINATNADGSTPLHTAAFYCRTEIVKELIARGADQSVINQYGSTALESVAGPFADVKPIYEQIAKDLGALGLRLDLQRLERTRPEIVVLLSK